MPFLNRSKLQSAVFTWAATTFLLSGYWLFVEAVLASNQGFELTDESLYLLAARDLAGTEQWGFPWGWHTAPLLALVGGDIADFRTLGGFLLGLVGGVAGVSTYLALERNVAVRKIFTGRSYVPWLVVFSVTGLLTSLLYYQALVRAPSYNWVNLIGLLIATSSALLLLRVSGNAPAFIRQGWAAFAVVILAAGLVYSSTGKPSSPVFALVVFFATWVVALGLKRAWILLVASLLAMILVIISLLVLGLWPSNFLDFFLLPLGSPGLTGSGVLGAAIDVWRVPQDFLGVLLSTGYRGVPVVTPIVFALSLSALSFLFRSQQAILQSLAIGMMAISSLETFGLIDWVSSGLDPQGRWIQSELPAGFLLILIFTFFVAVSTGSRGAPRRTTLQFRWGLQATIPLVALPLIYGFGSGHGAFRQSGMASIGYALATMAMVFALHRKLGGRKKVSMIWLSGISLTFGLVVVAVLVDSHALPYRIKPIAEQVYPAQVGGVDGSELLVDADTLEYLEDLSLVSIHSEWNAETGLIGLSWGWNASEAVVLDARTPPSLMLTLWGYPGSENVAIFNLSRQDSDLQWSETWLIIDSVGVLGDEEVRSIKNVLAQIETESGLKFPEDYELVREIDSHPRQGPIEIYRPLPK